MSWQLVTPDSPLAAEIAKVQRRWQNEFSGGSVDPWSEAWLFGYTPNGSTSASGYATFRRLVGLPPVEPRWALFRVWLARPLRRQGILSEVWPSWRERYGDFKVIEPSPAMAAFLTAAES